MEENSFNRARWEFDLTTKLPPEMPQKAKLYEGEMNMNDNKKSVKSLKKQLAAAIAMVCVAAVALGSSTYAWFVSNNTVKATTSTISAQSNAAFMYIRDKDEESTNLTADTSSVTSTALYPAHWVTTKEGNYANADIGKFYTAYGTTASDGTMVTDTLKLVEKSATSDTKGSPADAVEAQYAVKNTFFIGSKGTELSNLVVTAADLKNENGTNSTSENADLDNALRILVTCGDNWVLCDKNSILASNEGNTTHKLADKVSATETEVNIYVFYDGDDTEVNTNNLPDLKKASKNITVQFDATATTTQIGA